MVSTGS